MVSNTSAKPGRRVGGGDDDEDDLLLLHACLACVDAGYGLHHTSLGEEDNAGWEVRARERENIRSSCRPVVVAAVAAGRTALLPVLRRAGN